MSSSAIENGFGFKTSGDERVLFAVYQGCKDKIDLTAEVFKERLSASPFANLFINEYLVAEFLRRYKGANDKESFESEIGERRDASCDIYLSNNKLRANLGLTPSFGGNEIPLEDVKKKIAEKNITWGLVSDEEIEAVLLKKHIADFIVAKGLEPVDGVDAQFINLMPEVHERKPYVNENGDVDYRELGDIVIVHKDEVVMRRIPAVCGQKGRNVLGEIIEPEGGVDIPFSGDKKGVYVNPNDHNELLSALTGQPVPVPHGMVVSPVLTVKQVDFSTGNLRFDGTIIVQGDVKEGMRIYALEEITIEGSVTDSLIECMGNIHIKGGVTGNSELIANGDINVVGGIQGYQESEKPDSKKEVQTAKIVSHGSVLVGFSENFNIEAGVDIVIEKYSLNCQLMAGNKIVTGAKNSGKKPSIMGGTTWAMLMVKGTILGSSSGIRTQVQVGSNPYIQRRIQTIRAELAANDKKQADIQKILTFIDDHPEKQNTETMEQLHHTLSKLVGEAELHQSELSDLMGNMTAMDDAKIVADRGIYAGTEIRINNVLWRAQENRGKSVFRVEKREMTVNSR